MDPTADPTKFQEAISAFRKRVPMPDADYDALDEAQREWAFKVSGVAQADLVQQVFDGIERAIRDGTTLADFKADLGPALEEAWGGADAARLETVFRTNVMGAYNAGRYEVMSDPAAKEARPFWRFDNPDDDRTTEECSELNGTILPADDPFWDTRWPPLEFNCRSTIVPLSEDEAEEEGIDVETPSAEASDGFGAAPSRQDETPEWEPDSSAYDPDIWAALQNKLGD